MPIPPGDKVFAENVSMSGAQRERAQQKIDAQVASDHRDEAAREAEALVKLIVERWTAKGFTFEQGVFSLALATINFRETAPEKNGGKEAFDTVAREARKYYDANR